MELTLLIKIFMPACICQRKIQLCGNGFFLPSEKYQPPNIFFHCSVHGREVLDSHPKITHSPPQLITPIHEVAKWNHLSNVFTLCFLYLSPNSNWGKGDLLTLLGQLLLHHVYPLSIIHYMFIHYVETVIYSQYSYWSYSILIGLS